MLKVVLKEIMGPISRRLGTMVAVWLIAQGVDEGTAEMIAKAIGAAAFIAIDLMHSALIRNKGYE